MNETEDSIREISTQVRTLRANLQGVAAMTETEIRSIKADIEAQREAAQAEQVQKVLIQYMTAMMDKAKAYVNMIILAGYAGGFSIWINTKSSLSTTANVFVGLLLAFSISVYVGYELFGMVVRERNFSKLRGIVVAQTTVPMPPATFLEKVAEAQEIENIGWIRFQVVWRITLALCVLSALTAIGILFVNWIGVLIRS